MYLFYAGYNELDPKIAEEFMGFSTQTAEVFFKSFLKQYLETDDFSEYESTVKKAALFAYVRLIGQIRKKSELSDKDREAVSRLEEKIRDNLEAI